MLTLCAVTERIAVLGASRGIGYSVSKILEPQVHLLLVSRQVRSSQNPETKVLSLDLANAPELEKLFVNLEEFQPTRLFYIAGGGPYGEYSAKNFKDHLWAFQLNLLTPAKILHWSLRAGTMKQIIFVGSAIAEQTGDPLAASYSASKHGLLGLVRSVREENPNIDVRIYSPGYTATDLLPKSAREKYKQELLDPALVAQDFINWAFSENVEFHRIFRPRGN